MKDLVSVNPTNVAPFPYYPPYIRSILEKHLQEPTDEREDICLRCGVERKEVKRGGSNGCCARGSHYPKHLWK